MSLSSKALTPHLPAQVRISGSSDIVQSLDRCVVGSRMQSFGVFLGISGYLFHSLYKGIKGLFALRLSRFDHQGLVDYQGEIDGGGMKTVVKQTLGDIYSMNPLCLLPLPRKHYFMHAGTVVRQVIIWF